jgi:hypothetical protein
LFTAEGAANLKSGRCLLVVGIVMD